MGFRGELRFGSALGFVFVCVCVASPLPPTPTHQAYFVKSPGWVIYRPRPQKGPSTLSSPQPWFSSNSPDVSTKSKSQEVLSTLTHSPFKGGTGSFGLGRGAPAERHAFVPGQARRDFLGSCPPRGPCPHWTHLCC